jgi:sialic acid synthase SpsE
MVSEYDLESVTFLNYIQVAAIEISSANINHEHLIQAACKDILARF